MAIKVGGYVGADLAVGEGAGYVVADCCGGGVES